MQHAGYFTLIEQLPCNIADRLIEQLQTDYFTLIDQLPCNC